MVSRHRRDIERHGVSAVRRESEWSPGTWPEEELERVPACPVCRHAGKRLLYGKLSDKVFRCAPGEWQLWECALCKSAYLDPRPTPAAIWRAYERYGTHKPPANQEEMTPSRGVPKMRRALRHGYVNWRYGARLSPASMFGRWIVSLLPGKRTAIDHGLRSLPKLVGGETRKVLDIGCGNGSFLIEAKRLGWIARGFEADPKSAAIARSAGLDVEVGMLPRVPFCDAEFDVVTLNHVIEHLHDPVHSLREILRILKPGGKLWIATPNLRSASHWLFGPNWMNLHAPAHLVIFHAASLVDLLKSVGFESPRMAAPRQETGYFHGSWRIARDEDPFDAKAGRLPLWWRIAARHAALLATLLGQLREEIVVTAQKPFDSPSRASSSEA